MAVCWVGLGYRVGILQSRMREEGRGKPIVGSEASPVPMGHVHEPAVNSSF